MFNNLKSINKNARLYLLGIMFFSIGLGAFSMLHGLYMTELGLNEDFIGSVLSLRTVVMALASIPAAILCNKIGNKYSILISVIGVPITILILAFAKNPYTILIFSTSQGLFHSALTVSSGPFFMDNTNEKNRMTLFSYSYASNIFSTMVGSYLFGVIARNFEKNFISVEAIRYSLLIAGFISLLSLFFLFLIKDNKNKMIQVEKKDFKTSAILLLKRKNIQRFLIYNSIIGFGAGLVVPYFNLYLKYKISASTEQIGLIMAFAQLATGMGGLFTPMLSARIGKVKSILLTQSISIPFLMMVVLPANIYIVGFAMFMRSGLMNMAGPVVNSLTMEMIDADERSIFASINNISGNVTRAISISIGGYIMANIPNGYEIPYFLTGILYILASLLFYGWFVKKNSLEQSKKVLSCS